MERIDEAIRELEDYKETPYISDDTLDLCISLLKEQKEELFLRGLEKYVCVGI